MASLRRAAGVIAESRVVIPQLTLVKFTADMLALTELLGPGDATVGYVASAVGRAMLASAKWLGFLSSMLAVDGASADAERLLAIHGF